MEGSKHGRRMTESRRRGYKRVGGAAAWRKASVVLLATLPVEGTVVGGSTERTEVDSAAAVVGTTGLPVARVLDREGVESDTDFVTVGCKRLPRAGLNPGGLAVGKEVLEVTLDVGVSIVGTTADDARGGVAGGLVPFRRRFERKGLIGLIVTVFGGGLKGMRGRGRIVGRTRRQEGSLGRKIDVLVGGHGEDPVPLMRLDTKFDFVVFPERKGGGGIGLVGEELKVKEPILGPLA